MAEVTSNSELSRFDSRFRLLGLNNSIFNTNDLVEAELQILEAKAAPLKSQQTLLTEEKAVWESFKKSMSGLVDTFQSTRLYSPGQKKISYSAEGHVSFNASVGSLAGKYSVAVSQLAEKHQIAGKDLGSSENPIGVTDTVNLNGKDLELTGTMSLKDVVKKINEGDYGATASIISNRLILTSKESGESNALELTDGTSGGLKSLGLLNSSNGIANQLKNPQDAHYSINGVELVSSSNVITSALDGISMTLVKETTSAVNVTVEEDTDNTIKKIEELVNAYNKAISTIQSSTDKGTYLQGQTLPLQFRKVLGEITNFVSEDGKRLFEVGIEMDGTLKNGMLTLNKAKLESALKENPKQVENMFFGEKGVGKIMKDKVDRFTSETGSFSTAIEGLGKRLETINKTLDNFDSSYERQRESILAKYAAFETMMSNLNSQLSYMEMQIKALNGDS